MYDTRPQPQIELDQTLAIQQVKHWAKENFAEEPNDITSSSAQTEEEISAIEDQARTTRVKKKPGWLKEFVTEWGMKSIDSRGEERGWAQTVIVGDH